MVSIISFSPTKVWIQCPLDCNKNSILQFFRGEPAMAKSFFLNTTNPDYLKYFRSYKRLLLESILILSQGSPTVSSDVEDILAFETKFAEV